MKSKPERSSGSLSKELGIGSFIAAAIFLCNPMTNIIDILPDFFGYLFLLKALGKWADLCPNIADAVQGLSKLRWFMLLKLFAMVLVPLVDDTYVLVLTFAFAVIELIYLLPALGRMFDGFEYFGTRFNSRAIFVNLKNLRTLTSILFVVRSALVVFPELCSLSSFEYSGLVTGGVQINYADYKVALIILNFLLSTLIGILWLVNWIPYFKRIGTETDFLSRVKHDYDLEITNNFGLTFRRALRTVISLILVGFAFFPNLWIDEINIIPTFVGAIFLIAAMAKLGKISKDTRRSVHIQIIFAAVSFLSYAASLAFSMIWGLDAVSRDFLANDMYNITRILSLAEYVAMAFSVYSVYREMRKLIDMHLGPDPDVTDRRLTDIYASHQHEADNGIIVGFIGFFVALATNIVYLLARAPESELYHLLLSTTGNDVNTGAYWIIAFLATGIWYIYMINTLNQLYDQIEYKYI